MVLRPASCAAKMSWSCQGMKMYIIQLHAFAKRIDCCAPSPEAYFFETAGKIGESHVIIWGYLLGMFSVDIHRLEILNIWEESPLWVLALISFDGFGWLWIPLMYAHSLY